MTVYANEKTAADDIKGPEQTALRFADLMTLLTCENELPGGGYAAGRVAAAKSVDQGLGIRLA